MTNIKNTFKKILENSSKFTNSLKESYKKAFHNKWYAPFIYGLLAIIFLFLVIFLNIYFMLNGKYSLSSVFHVLTHWDNWGDKVWTPIAGQSDGAAIDSVALIKKGWFNIGATVLGGIGMTLAAVTTQSLTRNPIAEGSTLGLVQAAIFGVIFALSFGLSGLFMKYLFVMIFAGVGATLLTAFIMFNKKGSGGMQKIILAGLAIGIIFKTLTFIFKAGDANQNSVSFAYVLGGAESISGEELAIPLDYLNKTLLISSILISIAVVLTILNIKGMNLLEIGDERAKNLGSSVLRTRIINVIIVVLVLPATVIIVGNMAFLGLFTVHATRWLMRTRNYKIVLPVSLVIGMFIASFGLQLTEHFPQINSGLWMTFIGAPYLIYIGIKGLK